MIEISLYRRFYAEEIRAIADLQSDALVDAFARVPRESFLPPGPWQIFSVGVGLTMLPTTSYRVTRDARPERVYHNVAVAIDPSRQLNNGQPSSLATWIEALQLKEGERLLHLGAGTGYYSAVMAEVVGSRGQVDALEVDSQLAEQARSNLSTYPQVRVFHGDGSHLSGSYDAIFINAGATHPRAEWLDAMAPSGRMLLPLTASMPGFPFAAGLMALIRREPGGDAVQFLSPVAIFDCVGARDSALEAKLGPLLRQGTLRRARFLRRDPHLEGSGCVLHWAHFCFHTEKLGPTEAGTT